MGKSIPRGGKKTVYIDPVDISVILNEFPKEYFSRIHWDVDISLEDAFTDIHIIAKDILQKKGNSLAEKAVKSKKFVVRS